MITAPELRSVPLFAGLPDGESATLTARMADIRLRAGEWLIREGEQPSFFILLDGAVELRKRVHGIERRIEVFRAPNFFGELPLMLGSPAIASVRAMEPSRAAQLDYAAFSELFTQCETFSTELTRSMTRRFAQLRTLAGEKAPDAGAVDLYLTTGAISSAAAIITGTGYGVTTGSAEVTSGSLRVGLTASGTQDTLFQSAPVSFTDGQGITVVVVPSLGGKLANVVLLTAGASGSATLLQNPLARLKAVNGIPDAVGLNFKADGTTYTITYATTGGVTVIATLTNAELDAGGVYTAYLFGTPGNAQVKLVRDR